MSRKAYDKARTIDKRTYKQLWQELKELIVKEYEVRVMKEDELFISIAGEETADIEVFRGNDYIHVQLWYYDLPEHLAKKHEQHQFKTATDVINEIDHINCSIKEAKKHSKLTTEEQQLYRKGQ